MLRVPDSLSELDQWLLWRYEKRPGAKPTDKPTKVPYQINGRLADSTDRSTWSSLEEAERAYNANPKRWSGVGFVFSKEDQYVGIDVDNCVDGSGLIKPWARPILERFTDSYCEISPSGTGIKAWVKAGDTGGSGVAFSLGDGRIEVYGHSRYFAVTGRHWGEEMREIEEHASDVQWVLTQSPNGDHKVPYEIREKIPKGVQYDTLVSFAGSLRKRGASFEVLDAALQAMNREQCSEPGTPEDISKIARNAMRWTPDPVASKTRSVGGGTAVVPALSPAAETPKLPTIQELKTQATELIRITDESNDAAQIWSPALIDSLARVGLATRYEAIRQFKTKFPNDFKGNIRGWLAQIDEREAELRREQLESSPQEYILTEKGAMVSNVANGITMLRSLPLAYDTFACRALLTSTSPWGPAGHWKDYDDVKAAEWCQRQFLNVNSAITCEAADAIARSNPVHPVRNYLKSLEWDGTARLSDWLTVYMGCPTSEYTTQVAAMWMISAVARVMEPGCQADYTLVFEGTQGKRKSTALRVLGGEWFTDDIPDIGTKDSAIQLQGKWIVELSELDAFRRAEMTTIKSWLVRREDHFRPPYGRRADDFPRQNVFAASTNRDDWGQDDTGLRRFWPVRSSQINLAGLAEVRDQLWAEAFDRYSNGEQYWFDSDRESLATTEQAERQDVDAWRDVVESWIEEPESRYVKDGTPVPMRSIPGRIYLGEILWHCIGVPQKDWNQAYKARVSRIMKLAGYCKDRETKKDADDGRRPEFWRKMDKPKR